MPGAIRWRWRWRRDGLLPLYARRGIVDGEACRALLSRSGIAEDTTVVICGNPLLTGFAYWLLKACGQMDVRVLEGGREQWVAEGRPTTTRPAPVPRTGIRLGGPIGALRPPRGVCPALAAIARPRRGRSGGPEA